MTQMTQVEYTVQEFRENARMKRRQSEILCAEAVVLEQAADRIEKAIETDKRRAELRAQE